MEQGDKRDQPGAAEVKVRHLHEWYNGCKTNRVIRTTDVALTVAAYRQRLGRRAEELGVKFSSLSILRVL